MISFEASNNHSLLFLIETPPCDPLTPVSLRGLDMGA